VKTSQTTWDRKVYGAWPTTKLQKGNKMKVSQFKDYSELPLFLNAELVAKVLGVSPSSGYELMHEPGFPVLKIGSRMVVPKEKFIQWVEQNTVGRTQL
jgi:predicted DNA-binding transcriptional regulator AlpA